MREPVRSGSVSHQESHLIPFPVPNFWSLKAANRRKRLILHHFRHSAVSYPPRKHPETSVNLDKIPQGTENRPLEAVKLGNLEKKTSKVALTGRLA